MIFVGIDLAWGDRKPDGVCVIDASHRSTSVTGFAYPIGDSELLALLGKLLRTSPGGFLTIDAPIVCPNTTGTRPVDRLTHTLFHREHAACHPANSTKCPRPPRVRRKLGKMGIQTGWETAPSQWVAAEVYPHPAMVRLFEIPRIVKYKRGTVTKRRAEFARLQDLLRSLLEHRFPYLSLSQEARSLLQSPWSKKVEDLTDAFFCALIGLWHWKHHGKKSEILGNKRTGFILFPHLNKG
jgi:predicted RNase H-like nuclease